MRTKFISQGVLLSTVFLAVAPILLQGSTYNDGLRRNAFVPPIEFIGSTLYGPYEGGESVTFTWTYINQSSKTYESISDYIIISCPSYSASPLISKRVGRHILNPGSSQTLSYTYVVPYSRLNTDSGIVIKVALQYQSKYIDYLEKRIKPIQSQNINPLTYRSHQYEIKDRSFYFNRKEISESFLFDEYSDYVECDKFNRLLFGNLSFLYSYPQSLSYEGLKVKFMDRNNLYPSLNKDEDGYTSIKADFSEEEGRMRIVFNDLWYDPVSLVNNDSGTGARSKYLYVPKGRGKDIKDYEFIIEATGLGINKTSFSHCLETSVSPYYIGDCETADYCVVGGVKK